jgi:undecaprenyl-diphosphatase
MPSEALLMQFAHDTIPGLVVAYGYVVLFVIVALESFGIPLPGETALVTAAATAALGRLDIRWVIVTAAAAAIIGDNAGYWIGREGGPAFIRRYGRHVGLNEEKIARVHAFFERHGGKTVFAARFVALLRSWAAALAGASHVPYATFTLYNALGGVVWAATFGLLGYAFGRNIPLLQRYAAQASLALTLLLLLSVLLVAASRWFWRRRELLADRVANVWQRVASSPSFAQFRQRHTKLWTLVAARLARGEYLGLHLTIGLVVSVAALWLFGGVTEDVIHHDPLTKLDLDIVLWFRAHSTPALDRIAVDVSLLGSPVTMAVLGVIVAIVLAARRRWILLGGWSGVFAGGGILDWGLKRLIQRPRPSGASAFLNGESFSFPSGHAMGSLFGYGMLAYLLARFWAKAWRQRLTIIIVTLVLVLGIGLSRLYLGVHYFSDVVAGYAAGLVWLASCISGVEITLGRRGHYPWEVGLERRAHPRPSPTPGQIIS